MLVQQKHTIAVTTEVMNTNVKVAAASGLYPPEHYRALPRHSLLEDMIRSKDW